MTRGLRASPVRAVVFDMDGVLIDSHPAHRAAWREFLRLCGLDVDDAELSFILEGRSRSEILRHFFRELSDDDVQAHGKRKDEIFRAIERNIGPIPGVIDFIDQLKRSGISIAVATSASEIRTFSTIERMGLGGCFEAVITASDVPTGKPDPAVYRVACERMGIAPRQCVAFDDAVAGIDAARNAGMNCIGVSSNGNAGELIRAGATQVIADFVGFGLKSVEAVFDEAPRFI